MEEWLKDLEFFMKCKKGKGKSREELIQMHGERYDRLVDMATSTLGPDEIRHVLLRCYGCAERKILRYDRNEKINRMK